jgi:(S)-sulfolactate dehydrogenase
VIPATGANALSVAEYVNQSALMLLRGAYQSTADVVAGHWPRGALSNGREARGRFARHRRLRPRIGRLTAELARAIGMRVLAFDEALPLDDAAYRHAGVERCARLAGRDGRRRQRARAADRLERAVLRSTAHRDDAPRFDSDQHGRGGGVVDEAAVAAALKSGSPRRCRARRLRCRTARRVERVRPVARTCC